MRLYIKETTYSFRDKYNIYDENETIVYSAVSEFSTIQAKIYIYDSNRKNQFLIKKKVTFLLGKYEIYDREMNIYGIVSQEVTLHEPKLRLTSRFGQLYLAGDFMNMEYDIYKGGQKMGSVRKVEMPWGDCYEIYILPPADEAGFICALVITIYCCLYYEEIS